MERPKIERLNPRDRVIVNGPTRLWDEDGKDLSVWPARQLGAAEIRAILRSGRPVPFVTAVHQWGPPAGSVWKWIRGDDRFDFWKNEVQPHLLEPGVDNYKRYDEFPDEYCYEATEWRWDGEDDPHCIVLTAFH